ncbi:hypothetical protein GIB67_034165 [Kingdonia uniflora]|uniref:Uncharacterized protein n=1 Tax=Kingdonia uniflora TaxID=39325 RepID=A0A7J7LRW0_9MAGN|nr:hypothetical protein GIB67_034165 [Kingdonia uniflora]
MATAGKCVNSLSYLQGHGWDVKSVDWHPTKSLLVSGGKDNLVKLWDTKSGRELSSFHGHKNTVLCVKWNENGNWVLTASKDQIIKLYDIRAMKELQSFRGHSKDVTGRRTRIEVLLQDEYHIAWIVALKLWLGIHSMKNISSVGVMMALYFTGLLGDLNPCSYFSRLLKEVLICRHEDPQVEVVGAHENSVWDLAWHPIGYILCSGSNDHTTRFWSRNRPGDPPLTKLNIGYNQGYGEHNPAFVGRAMSNFPGPETPTTPGPFATGLNRNEGTIPGIGVAMPLPNDPSDQGEQKQSLPGGAPPLPPGPHPSLLASSHQQTYQQSPQHFPQHHQQQMSSLSLPPSNFSQLQPPPHLPPLPHPHLPRPPALQLSPFQSSIPMPSSVAFPMPGTLGMQGSVNQMVPPLPQGHIMGMNPMHSSNNLQPPSSGFGNGMPSMQGGATGAQMYPANGAFNRGQPGQFPGLNTYQSGNPSGAGMGSLGPNMGHPPGLPPPPPPPPQQHQQQQPHG